MFQSKDFGLEGVFDRRSLGRQGGPCASGMTTPIIALEVSIVASPLFTWSASKFVTVFKYLFNVPTNGLCYKRNICLWQFALNELRFSVRAQQFADLIIFVHDTRDGRVVLSV